VELLTTNLKCAKYYLFLNLYFFEKMTFYILIEYGEQEEFQGENSGLV